MKIVRGRALNLILELVNSTDSITDCLERSGVASSTFYRWLKDPVFLEKLQEERTNFESGLRGKFVSKRRRIEELERLYDQTPMESDEYHHTGQLKRVWLNVNEKRAILKAIKEELEGLDIRLGEAGAADDQDLITRRRKAADELEAWENEQELHTEAA